MDTIELKFLLKLLSCADYRTPLTAIILGNKTKVSERNKICRQLCDRGLVECSYEVIKLKIAPPGKALLKLDQTQVPVTQDELKALKACENKNIPPGETRLPAAKRQTVIQGLAERGLIEVEAKVKEVWLSEEGKAYLRDEYIPKKGFIPVISLDLLSNYLRFIRKSFKSNLDTQVFNEVSITQNKQLSELEVLETIQSLDQELGTENYLPIFHLRQKLATDISRKQLDEILYRLQRNDQIELSSLQEVTAYTSEQIDAGIPQDIGGPLFFIVVN